MKKNLFILSVVILLSSFSVLQAGNSIFQEQKTPLSLYDTDIIPPSWWELPGVAENPPFTSVDLEDLTSGEPVPRTPGMAAIEIYQGNGYVLSVFNKAKAYTLTCRNEIGQVVYVTSIVPEMETHMLQTGAYPSGNYTITYTNARGVDTYSATFSL